MPHPLAIAHGLIPGARVLIRGVDLPESGELATVADEETPEPYHFSAVLDRNDAAGIYYVSEAEFVSPPVETPPDPRDVALDEIAAFVAASRDGSSAEPVFIGLSRILATVNR